MSNFFVQETSKHHIHEFMNSLSLVDWHRPGNCPFLPTNFAFFLWKLFLRMSAGPNLQNLFMYCQLWKNCLEKQLCKKYKLTSLQFTPWIYEKQKPRSLPFTQFTPHSIELRYIGNKGSIYMVTCYFFLQMAMSLVTMPTMLETSCIQLCLLTQGLGVKWPFSKHLFLTQLE